MRQIVLDTETTGLSPAQGHRSNEMGAIESQRTLLLSQRQSRLVLPFLYFPYDALSFTTDGRLRGIGNDISNRVDILRPPYDL